MIEKLDDMVRGMVRAEHGDEDDTDNEDTDDDLAGLYFPLDYVLLTWLEKKERGILPEPGGLNDQDWRLVFHDWPLVTARYNRLSRELYPPEPNEKRNGIRLPKPGKARSFMDVMGEG